MEKTVYLSSMSGSGENGRNCHLIEYNDKIILLDCGVKREIIDGTVGFYPGLTPEIVSKISCVFLSHCHEDHVAALPLLYHLGYNGLVYATKETIAETPGFMRKWAGFVKGKNGVLPFDEEDIDKVQFAELTLGTHTVNDFEVTLGRSGHVLGSTWYVFEISNKKVLYTGDMVMQSATLATDIPPVCDGAILNGAYAGKTMSQSEQYQKLLNACKETYARGGSALLPIPPKGRGIDIAMFLDENLSDVTIYLEDAVVKSMNALVQKSEWIKDGLPTSFSDKVVVISNAEERAAALAAPQGIYITGDGMLTTEVSHVYYHALKGSELNTILITGHAAKGTVAAGVLDDECREADGVKAYAEKIIFKVHLDDEDMYQMVQATQVKKVVPFHADVPNNANITNRLAEIGVELKDLHYPEKWAV